MLNMGTPTAKEAMVSSIKTAMQFYRYAVIGEKNDEDEMNALLKDTIEKELNAVKKLDIAHLMLEMLLDVAARRNELRGIMEDEHK